MPKYIGDTERIKRITEKRVKSLRELRKTKPVISSEETKQKISNGMKKARAEGRAHNIGESKHKSEPSYPEQFFTKVIANEFDDKQYEREVRFGIYALDFAWVHKKKCIEIDGQQHERFEKLKNSDIKKDQKLKDAGWEVLRLKWKDVFKDTKAYIKIANEFIGK